MTGGGVPGLVVGKETKLSELAGQAIRLPEGTGLKVEEEQEELSLPPKRMGLEERREALMRMKEEVEREVEQEKERFEKQMEAMARARLVVQA